MGPKVPEVAACGGCRRRLVTSQYSSQLPADDVPDDQVSWTVVPQGAAAPYTLLCTCGHYTVVSYFPRRRSVK